MRNKSVIWLVRTAVCIALLVALQAITKPLGQMVTGSCVNFVLVASVLIGGFASGVTVAAISPFMAFLLQIAPMPIYLVPGVAIGNIALVVVYYLILNLLLKKVKATTKLQLIVLWIVAIAVAAAVKFGVLYLVIKVLIVAIVTAFGGVAKAPAALYSIPQLFTALIGGAVAMAVVKPIEYALNRNK